MKVVGGIGLRVVLLGLLYLSVTMIVDSWRPLRFALTGIVSDGVVVRQVEELVTESGGPASGAPAGTGFEMVSAHRFYRAIVEFGDGIGTYRVEGQARSPVAQYAMGSHVDVIYPRNRPADAVLRAELPSFWTQSGYLMMGTMLGAAALYWWWKLLRRRGRINPLPGSRTNG